MILLANCSSKANKNEENILKKNAFHLSQEKNNLRILQTTLTTTIPSSELIIESTIIPSSEIIKESAIIPSSDLLKESTLITSSDLIIESALTEITKETTLITSSDLLKESTLITSSEITKETTLITSSDLLKESTLITSSNLIIESALTEITKETTLITSSDLIIIESTLITSSEIAKETTLITSSDITVDSTSTNSTGNIYGIEDPIIIGFQKANISAFIIMFYTYLRVINYNPLPNYLTMEIDEIKKNNLLRNLDTNETIYCNYTNENRNNIYQYLCNTTINDSEISINLDTILLNGINKVDYTPLADYTKDLKYEGFDFFKRQLTIYNCIILNQENWIEIQGNIDNNSNITANNPYLLVVTNNNDIKNISCNFSKRNENNELYSLTCYSEDDFIANLDKSIGSLNDDNNFILSFNESSGSVNYTYKIYTLNNNNRKCGGLSPGAIVDIIVPCAFILIAIIVITALLRLKKVVPPPTPIQNLGNNTSGIDSSTNVIK